jgi:hypothetical protein
MSPAGSNLFRRVFFIFRTGLFFFWISFFSFSGFLFSFSESAESVAPITFCQLPGSAKHNPVPEHNRDWPLMARRAYKPVVTVTRNRRGAKLGNQEAADGVERIRADTGLEPEFHGSVQRKGSGHRTRNSVTATPAGDGLFWAVLFSLNILARPSITWRCLSCAATELGSKMVARRSVFVRSTNWVFADAGKVVFCGDAQGIGGCRRRARIGARALEISGANSRAGVRLICNCPCKYLTSQLNLPLKLAAIDLRDTRSCGPCQPKIYWQTAR